MAVRALAPHVPCIVELEAKRSMELLCRTRCLDRGLGPISLPPFAAGRIASTRLLDGWLAHAYLNGNTVRVVESLLRCDDATDSTTDSVAAAIGSCKPFDRSAAPFAGWLFGEVFHVLASEQQLCVALLRQHDDHTLYEVTNPSQHTELRASDRILVLAPRQPLE